jgi:8-oxo-dGTP pyrophosphatase MutT (NUDIX family)
MPRWSSAPTDAARVIAVETLYRVAARIVPVNADGAVLLLRGCDPAVPDEHYWFTIGGAVEEGESLPEAAIRELREETGIVAESSNLSEPFHRGTQRFSWGGYDIVNDSTFFALELADAEVTFDGLEEAEVGTIFEARWWQPDDLAAEPLSNGSLPDVLKRAVATARGA